MNVDKQDLLRACKEVWPLLSQKAEKSDSPIGMVLGGQPGAGKSNTIKALQKQLNKSFVFINADEFRSYHPCFDEIQQQYGKDAPLHTGEFAGNVASAMLHMAIRHRYNIIIEGTFRNPDTPINTLKLFKENGYQTEAHVVTTPKEISWQATIDRARLAEISGAVPRYVNKDIHDNIVKSLPKNADKVFASKLADRFVVHSREKVLFDSAKNIGTPGKSIENELNRLSKKQERDWNVTC